MRKICLALTFGTALAASSQAARTTVDLIALEVFPSDAFGNPISPDLAGTFYATLRFEVRGPLTKPYSVSFETPYRKMSTPPLTFGVGAPGFYQVTWGTMPILTDQLISLKAKLVPSRGLQQMSSRNDSVSKSFSALRPVTGIEYFDSKNLSGSMNLHVQWNSNPGASTVWLPNPSSESFQVVTSSSLPAWTNNSGANPFIGQPVMDEGSTLDVVQAHTSMASNQRVNRDELRTIGFADYALAGPEVTRWLNSETYAPNNAADIVSFARKARAKSISDQPFDVAEAIYTAILQRCSYKFRTGNVPSAVTTYRTKKGDCGGLSALFVAALRSQGIPARAVVGFTRGESQWHVWAEFYIPHHGWVGCDPAYAKGAMPSKTLPLFFGVMPDLNQRFATGFGFDAVANGQTLPFLQAPSVFWANTRVRAVSASSTSQLTEL